MYKYGVIHRPVCVFVQRKAVFQQDKQCTYNVTLRRVRVTIAAVEKKQVLHILSVCLALADMHSASVACLAVLYFPPSHEGTIFGKRLLNIKCV